MRLPLVAKGRRALQFSKRKVPCLAARSMWTRESSRCSSAPARCIVSSGLASTLAKSARVLSRSILMVINVAPVAATGTIRRSTTRIESTREMGVSWCGVEWRAETGDVVNVCRRTVSYQTIVLPKSGNESYSESHRATPRRRSRPFQAMHAMSLLSRRLNVRLKRNVPQRGGCSVACCGGKPGRLLCQTSDVSGRRALN
jgi:hypothetical protein